MIKIQAFFCGLFKTQNGVIRFFFITGLILYFAFGFYHLSKFISADEHFWLPNSGSERIENYWKAIDRGDWGNTRINDKPGITLAYTSGIALLFDDAQGQIIQRDDTYKQFDPARTQKINFLYRLPILLISGFFSFFFFWVIKRITRDEWIALWSAIGILLSPILLGISQIVNPDSLFWIFGSASFFSFFAFFETQGKKFAWLASLFLGLGLASKYVSIIFIPFFFFMMHSFYFFEFQSIAANAKIFRQRVLKDSLAYLGIIAGGFFIFAVMMPASFVEPKVFYIGTIGFPGMEKIFWTIIAINALVILDAVIFKSRCLLYLLQKLQPLKNYLPKILYLLLAGTIAFVIINWLTRNSIVDLSDISFNTKRKDSFSEIAYYQRFIMEFVSLVFSLTPIALFSLFFIWIKGIFEKINHATFVFILSAFFLVFYIAVIQQGLLVTVRYSIILFPFALVLSAMSIREFFSQNIIPARRWTKLFFITLISVTLVLLTIMIIQQNFFDGELKKVFVTRVFRSILSVIMILIACGIVTKILYKYFPWKKMTRISMVWISIGLILFNIISILSIAPFYFSYTNELLPKNYIISGAWGYGGYEAAQYLNSLPNAKNLTVWADAYGVCEFFVGKCIRKAKVKTDIYKIDYYFQSLQATIPLNFPHPMEDDPVWEMYIDNRPKSFLNIHKAIQSDQAPIDNETDNNNSF